MDSCPRLRPRAKPRSQQSLFPGGLGLGSCETLTNVREMAWEPFVVYGNIAWREKTTISHLEDSLKVVGMRSWAARPASISRIVGAATVPEGR